MIYSASLIYTLIALVIKIIANDNTYCASITSGSSKIYQEKPIPLHSKNMKIIGRDIKKLTRPLVATDIGSISLGKYTFLIIPAFPVRCRQTGPVLCSVRCQRIAAKSSLAPI